MLRSLEGLRGYLWEVSTSTSSNLPFVRTNHVSRAWTGVYEDTMILVHR